MKKIIIISGLIFCFLSCKKEEAFPSNNITESTAIISDNYVVDGCQLNIRIQDSVYTTDDVGEKIINNFVKDSLKGSIISAKVILGYTVLGTRDTILCGESFKLSKQLKISYIKPNK